MIRNEMTAVTHTPSRRPAGFQALKSGWSPILPMMPKMSATVAFTTLTKAAAMMKATASSTRLPRRMKFLKPVMVTLPLRDPSGAGAVCSTNLVTPDRDENRRGRRGGDLGRLIGRDRGDHQPAGG